MSCSCDKCVPWTVRENWGWGFIHTAGEFQTVFTLALGVGYALDPTMPVWTFVVYFLSMLAISATRYCIGDELRAARRVRAASKSDATAPEPPTTQ